MKMRNVVAQSCPFTIQILVVDSPQLHSMEVTSSRYAKTMY